MEEGGYMTLWKFSVDKFDILMILLVLTVIFKDRPECFISLIIIYCTVEIRKILIKILEKVERSKNI